MFEQKCTWVRIRDLIWETQCKHKIGTPRAWEPIEGMACMCCGKPVYLGEGVNEDLQVQESAV